MKMKLKTSKSAAKRFKVSANGKLMRRPSMAGHFNAKATGSQRRTKRGREQLNRANNKDVKNLNI